MRASLCPLDIRPRVFTRPLRSEDAGRARRRFDGREIMKEGGLRLGRGRRLYGQKRRGRASWLADAIRRQDYVNDMFKWLVVLALHALEHATPKRGCPA